jgi:hypothetical protein
MVGEFPELQGLMGRHYALAARRGPARRRCHRGSLSTARPLDRVPTDPVAIAVALADKLDTLVGFWAIGEKPTGSKDPYALRRAALGVVRILVENGKHLSLMEAIYIWFKIWFKHEAERIRASLIDEGTSSRDKKIIDEALSRKKAILLQDTGNKQVDLLAFFHDRLKVYLRDKGARHDLIDAALAGASPVIPGAPKAREGDPGATGATAGSPSRPATQAAGDDTVRADAAADNAALAGASPVIPGAPKAREGNPGATGAAARSPSRPAAQAAGDDTKWAAAAADNAALAGTSAVIPGAPKAREGDPGATGAAAESPSRPAAQAAGDDTVRAGAAGDNAAQAGDSRVIPGAPKAREGDPGATGATAGSPSRPAAQAAGDDTVRADAGDGRHSAGSNDDLLMVVRRVEALGRFLDMPDGQNLLAGVKRASNILRIEEKKDGPHDGPVDPALLALPQELALAQALEAAAMDAREHVANEDFAGAMAALARLRPAVDAFFEQVTVNADDPALRVNRLRLLARLREATREVADFSLIQGQ